MPEAFNSNSHGSVRGRSISWSINPGGCWICSSYNMSMIASSSDNAWMTGFVFQDYDYIWEKYFQNQIFASDFFKQFHDHWNSTPPVLDEVPFWLPQTWLWLLEFDASGVVYNQMSNSNIGGNKKGGLIKNQQRTKWFIVKCLRYFVFINFKESDSGNCVVRRKLYFYNKLK